MSSRVCLSLCLLSLLSLASTASLADEPAADRQTRNVVLITLDGLRWQELFGGADESLMNAEFGNIKGEAALRERFWRDTPEERRQVLMVSGNGRFPFCIRGQRNLFIPRVVALV